MKKLIGLVVIVAAAVAVLSYLSRDRIQEKIEERMGEKSDGHGNADEFLRQEEVAAPAASEPF